MQISNPKKATPGLCVSLHLCVSHILLANEVEKWLRQLLLLLLSFFILGCPCYFKGFYPDTVYSHSKSKYNLARQRTFGDWLSAQSLVLTSAKALVFLSSTGCGVDIQHFLVRGEKRKFQDRISESGIINIGLKEDIRSSAP